MADPSISLDGDDDIKNLSAEDRAAFKAAHPNVRLFALDMSDEGTVIVFRALTSAEAAPLINGKLDKAADRTTTLTQTALRVLVSPTKEVFQSWLPTYPLLGSRVAGEAMSIASGEGAKAAKKL